MMDRSRPRIPAGAPRGKALPEPMITVETWDPNTSQWVQIDMWSITEVAAKLSLSTTKIRHLIRDGVVTGYAASRDVTYFTVEEIARMFEHLTGTNPPPGEDDEGPPPVRGRVVDPDALESLR